MTRQRDEYKNRCVELLRRDEKYPLHFLRSASDIDADVAIIGGGFQASIPRWNWRSRTTSLLSNGSPPSWVWRHRRTAVRVMAAGSHDIEAAKNMQAQRNGDAV